MSTTLFIRVNEDVYKKYQSVLDAKELVSATQITYNFVDGTLLKIATALLINDNKSLEYYTKTGKKAAGEFDLKEIYLPGDFPYEEFYTVSKFRDLSDKEDLLRGCIVVEIRKQFKLYCRGKRSRR